MECWSKMESSEKIRTQIALKLKLSLTVAFSFLFLISISICLGDGPRSPYYQCQNAKNQKVSIYPRSNAFGSSCFGNFTYCTGNSIAVRGQCPEGLFFNPIKHDCDLEQNIAECLKKAENAKRKKKKRLIPAARPLLDDPNINDCSRKPCGFYPDAESDDGESYIFCIDGTAELRKCPAGSKFDAKALDCLEDAKPAQVPEPVSAKKEPGNPLVEEEEPFTFKERPVTAVSTVHPPLKIIQMKLSPDKMGKKEEAVAALGEWSDWLKCPENTYFSAVQSDGFSITCSNPVTEEEATLKPTKEWGQALPEHKCSQSGVIVGYKIPKGGGKVEFFCSDAPPEKDIDSVFCAALRAVCQVSVRSGSNGVTNIRFACCPVPDPLTDDLTPEEGLELVLSCENLGNTESWTKCEVTTGVGVSMPPQEGAGGGLAGGDGKVQQKFYISLGYDITYFQLEMKTLLRKTQRKGSTECYFPWEDSEDHILDTLVQDRFPVTKKLLVPPGSRSKLHQVYAKLSYMRVYTPVFLEEIEDQIHKMEYEEWREVPDDLLQKARNANSTTDGDGGGDVEIAPDSREKNGTGKRKGPNSKAEPLIEPKLKVPLCRFHGLAGSNRKLEKDGAGAFILPSSKAKTAPGKWDNWGNCTKDASGFIARGRWQRHEVNKDGKKDKVGVVKLELGCKDIENPGKPEKEAESGENLEFQKTGLDKVEWDGGHKPLVCESGITVGYQLMFGKGGDKIGTDNFKLVCSCAQTPGDEVSIVETFLDVDNNGTWGDRLMCKPLQGLKGFQPKWDEVEGSADDTGMTAVKMKCVDIPSPGKTCEAKEEKVPMAKCVPPASLKKGKYECDVTILIGVERNSQDEEMLPKLNIMEGVGHTLPCVIPHVRDNFQENLATPKWSESMWHPLTNITGQIILDAEKGPVELQQVTGRCGLYSVRTNTFVAVPGAPEEFQFPALPLDQEPLPTCWQDRDAIQIIYTPEGEKLIGPGENDTLEILEYEEPETANGGDYTDVIGGIVIASPFVSDFGHWEDWKYCPNNSYVRAINVKHHSEEKDDFGVTTFCFRCHDPEKDGEETAKLEFTTPALKAPVPVDEPDGWTESNDTASYAIGFRLNSMPPQGDEGDDVATDNVGITCSVGQVEIERSEFAASAKVQKKGTKNSKNNTKVGNRGQWSESQICKPKQVICGFQGQLQAARYKPEGDDSIKLDNSALNNLKAKCCDVFDPVHTCKPEVTQIYVGYCDNSVNSQERPCEIALSVGVSYADLDDSKRKEILDRRRFYESIGYTLPCIGKHIKTRLTEICEDQKTECPENGNYDWSIAPDAVWVFASVFDDTQKVPAEKKEDVYQVVATCGDYMVKTNRYIVKNETLELPVKQIDLVPALRCWEDNSPIIADTPGGAKVLADFVQNLKLVKRKSLELNPSPYEFVPDGIILDTPVLETDFPDETQYSEWQFCKEPAGDDMWYADSVYVERQGTGTEPPKQDLSGLIIVGFECRNIHKNAKGDHKIMGVTPGAPILDEVSWDWRRCACGTGIGFQVSCVAPKQLGDDMGLESFKLQCSCSETIWKTKDEFPQYLTGLHGNWTKPENCRPRQAICGVRTRSKPFETRSEAEMDEHPLLTYDNMGITRAQVKCCDVPNPAVKCTPIEVRKEIGDCDNTEFDNPKRCIVKMKVGVNYDQTSKDVENAATFFESIGWGLDCVIDDLETNFKDHVARSVDDIGNIRYEWSKKQKIWHRGINVQEHIVIDARTKSKVFQIFGECGPYRVATDKIVREDRFLKKGVDDEWSGEEANHRLSRRYKPPKDRDFLKNCWAEGGTFRARDYIRPLPKPEHDPNQDFIGFHGYTCPCSFELADLGKGEIRVDSPDSRRLANASKTQVLEVQACQDGAYMVGFSGEPVVINSNDVDAKDAKDDLGVAHLVTQCEEPDKGKEGEEQLTLKHPGLEPNSNHQKMYFQECYTGVLVGFQLAGNGGFDGNGTNGSSSSGTSTTDQVGVETMKMVCSGKGILDTPNPPKNPWMTPEVIGCRPYQALCAVSGLAGPNPEGDWTKVDAPGITNLKFKCCDVPHPGNDTYDTPRELNTRVVAVCDNLAYLEDRECEINLDVGITYDLEKNKEESIIDLSVGYSIPCITPTLRKTISRALKDGSFCGDKFEMKRRNLKKGTDKPGPCTLDWSDYTSTRIFQHGLTSYNHTIPVNAQTRVEIIQIMGKLNNVLMLSNHFIHVTKNPGGEILSEEKMFHDLELFPELEGPIRCSMKPKNWKSMKSEVQNGTVSLKPRNKLKLDKFKSSNPVTPWNSSESIEESVTEAGNAQILTSMDYPQHVEAAQGDRWLPWKNCSTGTFVSHFVPILKGDAGNGEVLGIKFQCSGVESAGNSNGNQSSNHQVALDVAPEAEVSKAKLSPCKCAGSSGGGEKFFLAVGFLVKAKPGKGKVVDTGILCSCDGVLHPGVEISKGAKVKLQQETLLCPDRMAICGFQIQERKGDHVVDRVRASCCDVSNPLGNCEIGEKFYKTVVCDNTGSDKEQKCDFQVSIGMSYDFPGNEKTAELYEALGHNQECMGASLAKKFGTDVPLSNKTCISWEGSAQEIPLGIEWSKPQVVPLSLKVPELTRVEVFQAIGWCDPYVTYVDQFLMTSISVSTGHLKNTLREPNFPTEIFSLTGNVPLLGDTGCWRDNANILSVNNHALKHKPRPDVTMDGKQLLENPGTEGATMLYEIAGNSDRKGMLLPGQPEGGDDSKIIPCQEGAYIRKWGWSSAAGGEEAGGGDAEAEESSTPISNVVFLCSTPNNGDWKEFSLTDEKSKKSPPYKQVALGAFVGHLSQWDNGDLKDSHAIDSTAGSKGDMEKKFSDEKYCHAGQAMCGVKGKRGSKGSISNLQVVCCQTESPVVRCKPTEKTIPAAVCDNRRDAKRRKCSVALGVGVGYSLLSEHKMSSFFYSSIGYSPACIGEQLRRKFQVMQCKDQDGGCQYNWGSAPEEIWSGLQVADIETEVDPYERVEYRQQMGICTYDEGQGAILVFTPVFQRTVFAAEQTSAASETLKEQTFVFDDILKMLEPDPKCPYNFPNITEAPTTTEASIAGDVLIESEWLNPPKEGSGEKVFFHGLPESTTFDYADEQGNAIIMTGPLDRDLRHNLKTFPRDWKNCSENGYIHTLETDLGAIMDEKTNKPLDAYGLYFMGMECFKVGGKGDSQRLELNAVGDKTPASPKSKKCSEGCVAIGFEVQLRPYQGPVVDDTAVENVKHLCSCGTHLVHEDSGNQPKENATAGAGVAGGDWEEAQVCRPREAMCGYMFHSSDFQKTESLEKHDNVAISNLRAKCCEVPSPAETCEPKESKELNAICDNKGSKEVRQCSIKAAVGLTYDYGSPEAPASTTGFYDGIGWTLRCVKEELSQRFADTVGQSKVAPKLSWKDAIFPVSVGKNSSDAKDSHKGASKIIWLMAATVEGRVDIQPRSKVEVHQVIGQCGIYKVYTNTFVLKNLDNQEESEVTLGDLGNKNPEPCWADMAPLKGRNWLLVEKKMLYRRAEGKRLWRPFKPEDNCSRPGVIGQTPFPPFPVHKWYDTHMCPEGSYIRSIAVKRMIQETGSEKKSSKDVIGVVSLAYQCMTPGFKVIEEKVHVHQHWAGEVEKWRQEFKGDPGAVYQKCMGAAVGVEIESTPRGKKSEDGGVGILDIRFLCGMGIDNGFGIKIHNLDSFLPEVNRDIVCRRRQALCYSQAGFAKDPDKVKGANGGMTNLKMGCCDVPSPIKDCVVEEKSLLAVTCDNRKYNRERKCQYVMMLGIQYDLIKKGDAGRFYKSVGYTPTCLAPDLKQIFKDYPPEVFQEVQKMHRSISVKAKTRVDIYQTVGVCKDNPLVLVHTSKYETVTLDANKKELKRESKVDPKLPENPGKECEVPEDPVPAPPPPPGHVPNAQAPKDVFEECQFKEYKVDYSAVYALDTLDPTSNYIEGSRDLDIVYNHDTSWADHEWQNCSAKNSFITGFHSQRGTIDVPKDPEGNTMKESYGIDTLAFQCTSVATAGEKDKEQQNLVIQSQGGDSSKLEAYNSKKGLPESGSFRCDTGVAIGFALGMKPYQKFGDDEALAKFRMHCSCGEDLGEDPKLLAKHKAEKAAIEGVFKDLKKKKKKGIDQKGAGDVDYIWTDDRFCRPKEALCGVNIRSRRITKNGTVRHYDNIGVLNVRMKCCPVESPVVALKDQGKAEEKLVKIADCDNTAAKGEDEVKTCLLDVFVGLAWNMEGNLEKVVEVYESLGWTLASSKNELRQHFEGLGKTENFDWSANISVIWNKAVSLEKSFQTMSKIKSEIFQVIGFSAIYKVLTTKFIKKDIDKDGNVVGEEPLEFNDIGNPEGESGWEAVHPIRGRDWAITQSSAILKCEERSQYDMPTKPETLEGDHSALKGRTGVVIRTPNPASPYNDQEEWKFCPDGSYIRGWTSVAAGKEGSEKSSSGDDYSGIVFIKAICRTPENDPERRKELAFLEPKEDWDLETWDKLGMYGILNCVGAGIGIQGVIQMSPKAKDDKFYFHDSKLICSCGEDAGFVREGHDTSDTRLKELDEYATPQKEEVCRPREALCGLKVAWGGRNLGDNKKQDGFGLANLQAFCCDVPGPIKECAEPHEKLVFASACDNSRSDYVRKCSFNLAIGITYNFVEHETAAYFYSSNGFTPTCIAPEVRDKFTGSGNYSGKGEPKKCREKECGFNWKETNSEMPLWQEMVTITQDVEVEPRQRFRVYQIVGQCESVNVLTNHLVKVIADADGKEISRTPWKLDEKEIPPPKVKKCEF